MSAPIDVRVENHGTLFLFCPQTTKARQWIAHHVDPNAQRLGEAVAVEHRYIGDLVRGALKDGLVVR